MTHDAPKHVAHEKVPAADQIVPADDALVGDALAADRLRDAADAAVAEIDDPSFGITDRDAKDQAVREATERIRLRLVRTTMDIIETGQDLREVKAILGHGSFGGWLKTEFGWSSRTAERLMLAARWAAGKSDTVSNLEASALYLLSASNTPARATEAVLARLKTGEPMPLATVRQIVREAKRGPDDGRVRGDDTSADLPADFTGQVLPGDQHPEPVIDTSRIILAAEVRAGIEAEKPHVGDEFGLFVKIAVIRDELKACKIIAPIYRLGSRSTVENATEIVPSILAGQHDQPGDDEELESQRTPSQAALPPRQKDQAQASMKPKVITVRGLDGRPVVSVDLRRTSPNNDGNPALPSKPRISREPHSTRRDANDWRR